MLACFRFNCQTTLITLTLGLMALLLVPQEAFADRQLIPPANPWIAMEFSSHTTQAQILHDSLRPFDPDLPTFVLTHGMGALWQEIVFTSSRMLFAVPFRSPMC